MMMTLKEFSRRLSVLSAEKPATVNRQIRLWTEAGVLPVANDVFIGTGHARLYTRESLLAAAVAIELAGWGMTAKPIKRGLDALLAQLGDKRSGLAEVADGAEGEDARWLPLKMLLFREPAPDGSGEKISTLFVRDDNLADLVRVDGFTSPGCSLIMIELRRLWGKLR
jgi:hypothetical protein